MQCTVFHTPMALCMVSWLNCFSHLMRKGGEIRYFKGNSWKFHAHFKASCLSFEKEMMLQFLLISLKSLNSLRFHTLNRWLGKPRNIFVLWPVPKEKLVCLFLLFFLFSAQSFLQVRVCWKIVLLSCKRDVFYSKCYFMF